jgi:hypothetical protein
LHSVKPSALSIGEFVKNLAPTIPSTYLLADLLSKVVVTMLPIHASTERVDVSSVQLRGNFCDQFDNFLDPLFKADS